MTLKAVASELGANGTVTTVSVVTANGVSGSVANPTSTPAITVTLGAINPVSVTIQAAGALQLGNAATTGLVAGTLAALTNATIVITDSTGQAYRIPCII